MNNISGEKYEREPKITNMVRDTRPKNITLLNVFLSKEKWDFLNVCLFFEQKYEVTHDFFNYYLDKLCPLKLITIDSRKQKLMGHKWNPGLKRDN